MVSRIPMATFSTLPVDCVELIVLQQYHIKKVTNVWASTGTAVWPELQL
jgi:hypothetical protein